MAQPPTVPNQSAAPGRNLAQIIANLGPQSQLATHAVVDPRALAAGIKASFASLGFKGKTWSLRHRGNNVQLLQRGPNGEIYGPVPTIDIVIVKAATAISKAFYLDKYKEGDFKQPDCWSTNGQVPDPAAPLRQNPTCRGCRWDAFGSRTMDDGRKGKACADGKRLAVLPADDLRNEAYGGPMLLKLPPSSFAGLSELENLLHMQGYAYFGLRMRLSFDHTVAFPKIVFTPVGVLDDYQMQEVLNWQTHETTERILSEELVEVSGDPGQPDPAEQVQHQPSVPQGGFTQPAAHHPSVQQGQHPQGFTQPVQHHPQPTAFNPEAPQPQPQPVQGMIQPSQNIPPVTSSAFGSPPVEQVTKGNGAAHPQPQPQQPVQQPAATETPEQRIARLEAQLAAATAKPQRRNTKRTQPVTPAGNQQQPTVIVQPPASALPGDQPLPFTQQMSQPNGSDQPDDIEGDMPADLDDRIDKLLDDNKG